MSDPIIPEPTDAQPPVAPPAPVYAPVATGGKRGLSLASFILGIVGVVFFWTSWLAVLIGLAAVILGFIARLRESQAPRWMWLVGIILGFVAIVLGMVLFITALVLVVNGTPYN